MLLSCPCAFTAKVQLACGCRLGLSRPNSSERLAQVYQEIGAREQPCTLGSWACSRSAWTGERGTLRSKSDRKVASYRHRIKEVRHLWLVVCHNEVDQNCADFECDYRVDESELWWERLWLLTLGCIVSRPTRWDRRYTPLAWVVCWFKGALMALIIYFVATDKLICVVLVRLS